MPFSISIQEEDLSMPQDVSFVSDDDDDTSVITDHGEYRALLTSEEQSRGMQREQW
jgi:hypothetical protein